MDTGLGEIYRSYLLLKKNRKSEYYYGGITSIFLVTLG